MSSKTQLLARVYSWLLEEPETNLELKSLIYQLNVNNPDFTALVLMGNVDEIPWEEVADLNTLLREDVYQERNIRDLLRELGLF